ncbi:hypothetical protein EDB84DRAFT_1552985, partial [Lactarius hengduanensis]
MRHLCKNAQIRARLVEDSGDLDTIEVFQLPPSPAWALAYFACTLGLLCLHLARLLPGDFSQTSPSRLAPERRAACAPRWCTPASPANPARLGDCRSRRSPRLLVARRSRSLGTATLARLRTDIDMGFLATPLLVAVDAATRRPAWCVSLSLRAGLTYSDSVLPPLNLSELLSEETKRADIDIKFITVPLLVASGAGLCSVSPLTVAANPISPLIARVSQSPRCVISARTRIRAGCRRARSCDSSKTLET